jgi:hypothetical protein
MAKTESTAVNALIDLAGQKSVELDLGDDAADMFRTPPAALPPLPKARGTRHDMPIVAPARMTGIAPVGGVAPTRPSRTLPPPRPTGQRTAEGTPTPELFSRSGATLPPPVRNRPPTTPPVIEQAAAPAIPAPPIVAAPAPKVARSQPIASVDLTNNSGWFESTRDSIKVDVSDDDFSGTLAVNKVSMGSWFKRYALPGSLLVAGLATIGYLAMSGRPTSPTPTPTPTATATATPTAVASVIPAAPAEQAAPAPVAAAVAAPVAAAVVAPLAAPVAAPVAAPAAEPALVAPVAPVTTARLVNVRFDSQPSGATVMLVDGGKTSFLGTAPVDVAVDASRAYDVVFTLDGHPTQVQHLDATATNHITAMLAGKAAPQVAVTAPPPAPTPAPVPHHHSAPAHESAPTHESASGKGVLMVSSKPPCEIVIDGRATGLTTPQRAISLSAGTHKVTLVNKAQNLTKTSSVTISASQSTKLIQNLLK